MTDSDDGGIIDAQRVADEEMPGVEEDAIHPGSDRPPGAGKGTLFVAAQRKIRQQPPRGLAGERMTAHLTFRRRAPDVCNCRAQDG